LLSYGKGRKVLPANIARPLVNVSPKLGVFPYLDYHYAYSLGNYVKKDPSGSFEYTNLDMACKFAGTRDEIGFIMLHVDIDSHSPALLESIWDFARAPSLAALQRNLDTMYRINDRRKLMWEASEWKNYNDFRVFIMGIQGNNTIFDDGVVYAGCFDNQLQQFRGQSGSQDDIIPTEDIFTGLINYYPQNELTSYLMDMRRYRPTVVQQFFTDLEACKFSLATFELLGVDALVLLNAIVDQIFIFRNGHWMFVQKYIMANTAHPIATGGTPITTWIPNQIQACLTYQSVIQARISELGGCVGSEYVKLHHSLCETLGKKQELLAKQQQVRYTSCSVLFVCDLQCVVTTCAGARQARF
jgi:indoleamine 2,3-dioxygenase